MKDISAFPVMYEDREGNFKGMTLRDYFAGQALSGLSYGDFILDRNETPEDWYKDVAEASYKLADAMLKQREGK